MNAIDLLIQDHERVKDILTRLTESTERAVKARTELLHKLERADLLLGIATGKGRRGLETVLTHHGLRALFATLQTADDNPSKPHPAMLERAMAETGSRPGETVFVGDTTFDAEMARGAGVRFVGVAWGYHTPEELAAAGAERLLESFTELPPLVLPRTP